MYYEVQMSTVGGQRPSRLALVMHPVRLDQQYGGGQVPQAIEEQGGGCRLAFLEAEMLANPENEQL